VLLEKNAAQVTVNIFENLVSFEKTSLKLRPCLATSWKVQEKNRVWIFQLRRNVKFHDGTTFDAWAVKFNFERQMDPRQAWHYPSYGRFVFFNSLFGQSPCLIEKVEVMDPYTVKMVLTQPHTRFLQELALYPFGIVSPAAVRKYRDEFYHNPTGTGPFKLLEWRRGHRVVLVGNKDYWGNRPYLDRIIFEPLESTVTNSRQLERGHVDIVNAISLSSVDAIKENEKLKTVQIPASHLAYIALNTQRSPWKTADMRRGINIIIKRKEIADKIYYKRASAAAQALPPNMPGHLAGIGYNFEPSKGTALITRSLRRKEQKFTLLYPDLCLPYCDNPEELAQKICEYLAESGLNVKAVKVPFGELSRKVRYGEYDLALWGAINETGDPDALMIPHWDSSNARPGGTNVSFYKNGNVHSILWKARGTVEGRKREELYRIAGKYLYDDAPIVPLVHTCEVLAYNRRVRDITVNPTGLLDLSTVWLER